MTSMTLKDILYFEKYYEVVIKNTANMSFHGTKMRGSFRLASGIDNISKSRLDLETLRLHNLEPPIFRH